MTLYCDQWQITQCSFKYFEQFSYILFHYILSYVFSGGNLQSVTGQNLRNAHKGYITGNVSTVKPVLSGHSKRRPKIGFQDRLPLNAGQSIAECSKGSILQYFRPALSYHLSLRFLFCLFLSGRLRQVLLYFIM